MHSIIKIGFFIRAGMVVCGGFRLVRIVAQLADSVGEVPGGARTAERPAATDGGWAVKSGTFT